MSAKASGSNAKANGDATNRNHNQGNQTRKYTEEQRAAVIRVRKCGHTAFYEILEIEKTASEGEIKKAYRKLSLLTHPDKNGYEGADEAFKMVSRAFQMLSDPDKKAKYDKFGGDPDSRFGGQPSASSPFSGFAQSRTGGPGSMYEEEISPEELFNRFFGGGGMGGFGPFGDLGGQQFVFNLGGGPGFRVHQFGGGRPRRRPRDANNAQEQQPASVISMIMNLLPLLILFVLPLLSSLLSGSGTSGPEVSHTRDSRFTQHRTSKPGKLFEYYVDPSQVSEYTQKKFHDLDRLVETRFVNDLKYDCHNEQLQRNQMIQDAQGLFFTDHARLDKARKMKLASCNKLKDLGFRPD